MENTVEDPQRIKNRTIIHSGNTISDYLFKITEIQISQRYLHTYIHSCNIHNSQDVELAQMFIDGQIKKIW